MVYILFMTFHKVFYIVAIYPPAHSDFCNSVEPMLLLYLLSSVLVIRRVHSPCSIPQGTESSDFSLILDFFKTLGP